VVATTQTAGDNSTKVATTAYVNAITGTSGITGFKNRIINGGMVLDQRNAGASVTPTTGVYTLDRWLAAAFSASSKFSVQQNAGSITPPAGFTNYLGVTSLSAYSVVAGDFLSLIQPIEGYNIADLGWGTANAKTVTLSFWVRSSLTGTFGGALSNQDGSRSYPFSYIISAANTWELETITIAGDTTGTWLTTNGLGLALRIGLGVGSTYSGTAGAWAAGSNFFSVTGATSVVGTNGATFYITGVQLEKGSTATSFDYRPFGTELALCQRYFVGTGFGNMGICTNTTTSWNMSHTFPVAMRASPTLVSYSGTLGTTNAMTDAYVQDYILTTAVGSIVNAGITGARTSGWTTNVAGAGGRISMWNSSTAVIQFSAEL
jgi:hypothetical protein